ncbi:alginate lyase family protein [Herbaspirillum sp. DW155]|uniref:alginate lyase family protein n=1 Tax=Herbaspirillum sp. DW155 TaxID=3095609 RepID=UPI0030892440|nr:alginate lyase family protein [Herbaspirillum sp. DW155]
MPLKRPSAGLARLLFPEASRQGHPRRPDHWLLIVTAALLTLVPLHGWAQASCNPPSPAQLGALRRAVDKNLAPQPRAIAHVHTEGTLPHQGIRDASIEAEHDWPLMRQLAQLWQARHDPEDARQLSRLMSAWAEVYQPDFNPIDETALDAYIDAYAMARDALDADSRKLAGQFIRTLAEGYLQQMESGFRPRDGRWVNNWNSHRVKLAVLAAAALGDENLWGRARRAFATQIGRNILDDGSTLDMEERDALHYVVYDLEPLVRAAQTAQARGEHWLTLKGSGGRSLADALNWLMPYAEGSRTHEEFIHSRVPFDARRRDAGLPGYAGQWEPKGAARLYAMAATLDDRYAALARQLDPDGRLLLTCWGMP